VGSFLPYDVRILFGALLPAGETGFIIGEESQQFDPISGHDNRYVPTPLALAAELER